MGPFGQGQRSDAPVAKLHVFAIGFRIQCARDNTGVQTGFTGNEQDGQQEYRAKKTKFWTLRDSYVETTARMCTRCGAIAWFGDTDKLAALRITRPAKEIPETAGPDSTANA